MRNSEEQLIVAYFYASKFGLDKDDMNFIDKLSSDFPEVLYLKVDIDITANEVFYKF